MNIFAAFYLLTKNKDTNDVTSRVPWKYVILTFGLILLVVFLLLVFLLYWI